MNEERFIHIGCDSTQREQQSKIICLCGSTRFREAFEQAQTLEEKKGNIVLSCEVYPRHPDGTWDIHRCSEDQKIRLDLLHLDKIRMCDEVFVLNVGGYIGPSTRNEINYAKALGKPCRYWEKEVKP